MAHVGALSERAALRKVLVPLGVVLREDQVGVLLFLSVFLIDDARKLWVCTLMRTAWSREHVRLPSK